MAPIKSRKHTQSRFNQHVSTALAAMLLPVAAHAADAPAKPQALQEVTVVGNKTSNDFKADKAASVKYTEALINTPQSITVIKRELIEQQGAVTLTEALQNTPGVGTFFLGENGNTNTGDAVYMRGFDTSGSIYVDGVRDVGSISRDTFNIEQIDVLKGPAGTDSGRGAPTGSINLASKQANQEDAFYSSVSVGSGSKKRASADWNKLIDSNTGTAFRLNVMDQDSGVAGRHEVKNKRWAIAPTISFGLNGATRAHLSYLHVKQDNVPDGGVPTIGFPGYGGPDPVARPFLGKAPMVDPSNFYGAQTDFNKVTADMLTIRLEHDFAPTLKLQNTSRYGKTKQDYLLTSFMGSAENLKTPLAGDPSTWLLVRTLPTVKDQENQILTNQTTVTAQFDTGAVKHSLVAGLELTHEKQTNYGYVGTGTLPTVSLYRPDSNAPVAGLNLRRSGAGSEGSTSTQSLYLFDTLKVGEQWQFNGGVRVDHFNTSYTSLALSTEKSHPKLPVGTLVPTSFSPSDTLVNGKLAALYKPTPDSSVYAMIATSKQPPGGANFALSASANSAANPKFDPQATTTKEIGAKFDFLKQKLSLTAALYRTDVKNEVEQDATDLNAYYQTGKKRVQGLEIGITGEIMRNWLVSAGYTRMDTSVESGKIVTASGANNLSYTPKQAFTSWTSYTLPFGLKVGGGARFVDALMRGTDGPADKPTPTPTKTESYWVFDAMASYSVSKNVDLQLNVYNLANKAYVGAINKSGYRYTPGTPRSASLTANFKF
ncbi:catecholate siderophore receptor Fiu [Janthinobacterium fluminis]|uniref:Catecholate siderophore receptor Fiu n=1 Tax=Janthinobacterium fluminis TaxID=2987524 RepID=A0ABT5K072_9BURK|nr:catecholate siderophore receptor Fiu [Janthinobacterium fluminis]MDC8758100.1 catecholate siderophore receptor Fiu [Janthinobacterium fluminis]